MSWNWTSHCLNSHHLYSLQNGPIKNPKKLGSITFEKFLFAFSMDLTNIYGDYFLLHFLKLYLEKS